MNFVQIDAEVNQCARVFGQMTTQFNFTNVFVAVLDELGIIVNAWQQTAVRIFDGQTNFLHNGGQHLFGIGSRQKWLDRLHQSGIVQLLW